MTTWLDDVKVLTEADWAYLRRGAGMTETPTVAEALHEIARSLVAQAAQEAKHATPVRILALGMAAGAVMRMRREWPTEGEVRAEEAANQVAAVALQVDEER